MKLLVVLAAGSGTRLRPLTNSIPKGLVEIGGRSLISRLLEHFEGWADQIILVSGYCSHGLEAYVNTNRFYAPVQLIHNKVFAKTNSLYSAWLTEAYWTRSSEIIFTNSDVILAKDALSEVFTADLPIVLTVDKKECDLEDMRVTIDENLNLITRVSKEVALEDSFGEFTGISKLKGHGIAKFRSKVVEMLNNEIMRERGWYDLVFDNLAQDRQAINYIPIPSNSYFEIDTLEDLFEAEAVFS